METHFRTDDTVAAPGGSKRPALSLTESHLVRRTIAAGLALGLLGDTLLREGPTGIGFTLFALATLAALALLMRARRAPWTLGACLLLGPTFFFALVFVWRASDGLRLLNFVALVVAMAALSTALLRGEQWDPLASVGGYIIGALRVGMSAAFGGILLLRDAEVSRDVASPSRLRYAGAALRGALLTVPLLLIFGSLLTSADPVFARLVNDVFDIDFENVASHLILTAVVGWIASGYLRSAHFGDRSAPSRLQLPTPSVGAVEVGVVLGSLDMLFLAFVLVQLRYLFGGDAHVAATAGVSYAEYARSGFFELVCVTVLVLPLLLVGGALIRANDVRAQLTFRLLSGALLVLLSVIMISAMQRMWLYQRAYGLTESRVYASAAMAWLAAVFIWYAATVLRGAPAPFAFGALVAAWLVVATLDLVNPDSLVARTNLARLARGERFDAQYVTQLGADATPQLLAAVPTIPEDTRCAVVRNLLWRLHSDRDWRSWNVARARADAALAARAGDLAAMSCSEPAKPSGS